MFCNLLRNVGLIDMGYNGPAYTWTNKRTGNNVIYERLDRCLANVEWCSKFPYTTVYHLPLIYGDHAPILILLNPTHRKPKKSFKFENWWLSENDFHDLAKNSWNSIVNGSFVAKAKNLGQNLLTWCRKKKPLQDQIASTEQEILDIQSSNNRQDQQEKEKELITKHDSLLHKLSDYHKQRAKKHWVKDGDRNTSFFHQAAIKRRRKNRISSIISNDQLITNPDEIANVFIDYFSNLFCTDRNNRSTSYFPGNDDPAQVDWQCPDEQEVLQIIRSMKSNASPGPDGLNAAFFKAAWGWIRNDVMGLI
ncbi:Os06g0205337 [Oryza sativa Japonica Group]|uniref:Os06g0205337 protein n=1 Tax=Oryza sativa subsp. japonica TaxID=39947 RepID=A0A0P0WU81_ORYSJ|nr:hypothetical protein EE612_032557 [Oryza sativa]BAS96693.1 Os06g0205337 [Oryza sativa Japonica Group]